jgi:hypothetical protein
MSTTNVKKAILFYFVSILGFPGNNSSPEFQASGAYVFRPFSQTAQPVSTNRTV